MKNSHPLVVFRLDEQRFAVALPSVERIVRAAEVTPLPNAPGIVLGIIDIEGRVLPVLNLRRRLGLKEHRLHPDEQFIIARAGGRAVVLVVDETQDVIAPIAEDLVSAGTIAPGLQHIDGAVSLPDGLVLIHDLEKFLSLEEARALDQAMSGKEEPALREN